ncbi:MAG: hypothetical protein JWO67_820 [Streptosporangiaceae bacterium]|nr:hypothetical protein [Streptosporangiaceae bacterium]
MTDLRDEVAVLVHLLRGSGLRVGTHQAIALVTAAAEQGAPLTVADLYWAARTTLVVHHDDLAVYDRVFVEWAARGDPVPAEEAAQPPQGASPPDHEEPAPEDAAPGAGEERGDRPAGGSRTTGGTAGEDQSRQDVRGVDSGSGDGSAAEGDPLAGAIASPVDALRRRSFSAATEDELRAIQELMGHIVLVMPTRRSRRTRAAHHGPIIDLRRSVRSAIQTDGELLRRPRRRHTLRRRRLVLVLDVSGSMAGYSRALLHFAHAARVHTGDVEVFCFGTRLTRLTDELTGRDVDRALTAAADRVSDWAGGTQIGRSLATLNRTYGRVGLLRGAVVVICSDGLERGDPHLLGDEIARLARYAYRLVWVNPLKGDSRYEPLARGMAAALPHVDRFVSGHNLASLDQLAAVLRHL